VNIQEYISSGIVESYVLGLASHEEQLEFEQLCTTHAELRQAKEAFEISLEQHALHNAVPAPATLKEKIWSDLNLGSAAAVPVNTKPDSTKMQPLTPVRTVSFVKFLAAASIILLLGSTLLNFYFYSQYKSSAAKLDELIASNQQLADNRNVMETQLKQYETSFEEMKDPDMAVIAMKGLPIAPQSLTTVYWNKQTRDVYLLVNSLPKPAAGKQYQLWAIVNGKPVSAGLLNTDSYATRLVKMKNIPSAQAFAITLEKQGGSESPDLKAMYVMGKS
jgi:anti-sigma-K factor RskA